MISSRYCHVMLHVMSCDVLREGGSWASSRPGLGWVICAEVSAHVAVACKRGRTALGQGCLCLIRAGASFRISILRSYTGSVLFIIMKCPIFPLERSRLHSPRNPLGPRPLLQFHTRADNAEKRFLHFSDKVSHTHLCSTRRSDRRSTSSSMNGLQSP